jgi:hypothetical protein
MELRPSLPLDETGCSTRASSGARGSRKLPLTTSRSKGFVLLRYSVLKLIQVFAQFSQSTFFARKTVFFCRLDCILYPKRQLKASRTSGYGFGLEPGHPI